MPECHEDLWHVESFYSVGTRWGNRILMVSETWKVCYAQLIFP
jgi:hypothetical protein